MSEEWRRRLRLLARRAGLERVPDSVLLACVAMCVALVALGAWRWWPREGPEAFPAGAGSSHRTATARASEPAEPAEVTAGTRSGVASDSTPVWVHVAGAVRRPGVYQLPTGSRVAAALDAAGGVLGNAAPEGVNLARLVQDGEQILVPTKDEVGKPGGTTGTAAGTPAAQAAGSSSGPIDLNTADAALLDTLPGVGPSTAAKIVADREANGPFASVDDLGRVTGIGPKRLDALRDLVCVR